MNSQLDRAVLFVRWVGVLLLILTLGACPAGAGQEKAAPAGSAPSGAGSGPDRTAPAAVPAEAAQSGDSPAERGVRLFDGKTLVGWREAQFPASGKVRVEAMRKLDRGATEYSGGQSRSESC